MEKYLFGFFCQRSQCVVVFCQRSQFKNYLTGFRMLWKSIFSDSFVNGRNLWLSFVNGHNLWLFDFQDAEHVKENFFLRTKREDSPPTKGCLNSKARPYITKTINVFLPGKMGRKNILFSTHKTPGLSRLPAPQVWIFFSIKNK